MGETSLHTETLGSSFAHLTLINLSNIDIFMILFSWRTFLYVEIDDSFGTLAERDLSISVKFNMLVLPQA